jgi:hypothetical protein
MSHATLYCLSRKPPPLALSSFAGVIDYAHGLSCPWFYVGDATEEFCDAIPCRSLSWAVIRGGVKRREDSFSASAKSTLAKRTPPSNRSGSSAEFSPYKQDNGKTIKGATPCLALGVTGCLGVRSRR